MSSLKCIFCGGPECKYENWYLWLKDPDRPNAIDGLYSNWYHPRRITPDILAMQRPSTRLMKEFRLMEKFKELNIGAIFNLQELGEHDLCGDGLEGSTGFSYDPEAWMNEETQNLPGKPNPNQYPFHKKAISLIRNRRPKSVQNEKQQTFVRSFKSFLSELYRVFPITDRVEDRISFYALIESQRVLLHGDELRFLRHIPKAIFLIVEKLVYSFTDASRQEQSPAEIAQEITSRISFRLNLNRHASRLVLQINEGYYEQLEEVDNRAVLVDVLSFWLSTLKTPSDASPQMPLGNWRKAGLRKLSRILVHKPESTDQTETTGSTEMIAQPQKPSLVPDLATMDRIFGFLDRFAGEFRLKRETNSNSPKPIMITPEEAAEFINSPECQTILAKGPIIPQNITRLAGGLANFVYRLTFADSTTAVLKYFPPYLAINPSVAFSQERYFAEKECLKLFGGTHGLLCIPRIIHSNDAAYTIIMEDAGKDLSTLLDHLRTSNVSESLFPSLAQSLHAFYQTMKSTPPTAAFSNPSVWSILNNHVAGSYRRRAKQLNIESNLEPYLSQAKPFTPPEPGQGHPIQGDLWPNSIVINTETSQMWLLDFETARMGDATRDLAQLLSNLWVMTQNPRDFNVKAVREVMRELQRAFLGDPERDWREDEELGVRFVLTIVTFIQEKHYGIEDPAKTMLDAVREVEEIKKRWKS
ncbi:Protein tyrosine phosphatase domain-containing protein 1 [Phlyctochytrium planicorne]|nr:Protein tyrosine phosphatase domain-containing protein 1 [Phlyctochytrium planicorne]